MHARRTCDNGVAFASRVRVRYRNDAYPFRFAEMYMAPYCAFICM